MKGRYGHEASFSKGGWGRGGADLPQHLESRKGDGNANLTNFPNFHPWAPRICSNSMFNRQINCPYHNFFVHVV